MWFSERNEVWTGERGGLGERYNVEKDYLQHPTRCDPNVKYGSQARSNESAPNKLKEEDRKVTWDTEFCHSSVNLGIEYMNPWCKDAYDREVELSGSALIN